MLAQKHIHMIGIGGSAMAPLAGMLRERGFHVTGSDAGVYPPASTLLESLHIPYATSFNVENLTPAPDLIVVGNAISRGNVEVEEMLDRRLPHRSLQLKLGPPLSVAQVYPAIPPQAEHVFEEQ